MVAGGWIVVGYKEEEYQQGMLIDLVSLRLEPSRGVPPSSSRRPSYAAPGWTG